MNRHGTNSLVLILPALLMLAVPARAEPVIEEIVVTAQKRDQNLQDVPLAVTAVTGVQLRAQGINNLFDIDKMVPGLQMGVVGSDAKPAMRGARTKQVEANDVAVSFYTDGLYKPRHGQAIAGFVDVNRVEVLRGPQGTLFGRNSFGGLIHVITNRPSFEGTDYGFSLTGGDFSRARGEGFFNVPFNDKTALRIAAARETRDPYVENVTVGDEGGLKDADMTYARAQLAIAPTDAFDVNLRFEFWQDDSNGNGSFGYKSEGIPINPATGLTNGVNGVLMPIVGRTDDCVNGCGRAGAGIDTDGPPPIDTTETLPPSPFEIPDNVRAERDLDETTLAADINWAFDFAALKVTLAYMDYAEFRWADCDLSSFNAIACGNDITSETTMQEFQLTSLSGERFEWVAGLFFLQEDLTNVFLWRDLFTIDPVTNLPTAPQLNDWAPWMNQIRIDTTSAAVYSQATYSVTDRLRFTAGIRFTDDERDWQIFGQDPSDLSQRCLCVLEVPDGEGAWNRITWKAAIEADVSDDSLVYASVSTGFLAGNALSAFQGTNSYDEQLVTAYEIGSKNVFGGGRLLLNASLYFNDFEDLLSTRFEDVGNTTLAFTDNAGAVEALGLEVEIDWFATERLQLGARLSFTNAEYGDFIQPNVFQEGGQTIGGVDNVFQLDGEQVQFHPDITATLLGSYTFDLGNAGSLRPSVSFYYSDDYYTDDSRWFFGFQESYTKTDLSLSWFSPSEEWSVRAFVNNLEDEEILLLSTRFGGDVAVTDYAPPQHWGVTVNYRY